MATIQHARLACNPRNPDDARSFIGECDTLSYVDTVMMFSRDRVPDLNALWQSLHRGRCLRERVYDRHGELCGHRIIVHQPTIAALRILDALQEQFKGVVSQFDLANDFITKSTREKEALYDRIRSSVRLRWRRPDAIWTCERTVNWIWHAQRARDGKGRANRNVALYDHKPCKITGEIDCVHLELKFLNSAAVKKQGIARFIDLIGLEPANIVKKHLKLTDYEAWLNWTVRKWVQQDKKERRHKRSNRHSPFYDAFEANMPRRYRELLRRMTEGTAQKARDIFGATNAHTITIDELHVPTRLSWPLPSSSSSNSHSTVPSHRHRQLQSGSLIALRKSKNTFNRVDCDVRGHVEGRSMDVKHDGLRRRVRL